MKKLLSIFISILICSSALCADQWSKTEPLGTRNASDIDTYVGENNEALDRLLIRYKRGVGINYTSDTTITALIGELAIPNSSDGTVRWRRLESSTSIGWTDIDTGAEENSTQYYVYATADTDITGMVFKISKSSTAPSGITYYRKIGQFYNNSDGDIEKVISYRPDYGTDHRDLVKAWVNFTGTGTLTVNDSYNVASITDNGTGDYTITFDTAFASAYYSCVGSASSAAVEALIVGPLVQTTSYTNIEIVNAEATRQDADIANLIFIGDMS